MGRDVIIACDFDSAEKTFAFLDKFTGKKPFVKIGMELYYAEGLSSLIIFLRQYLVLRSSFALPRGITSKTCRSL